MTEIFAWFDIGMWFLFPVGIAIATLAMSSGISASNFTVPLFVLGLQLQPKIAFWLALLSMMFGFSSGAIRNFRAGTIEWYLVGQYVVYAAPAGVLGAVISGWVPQLLLLSLFAVFIGCYGTFTLYRSLFVHNVPLEPTETIYRKTSIAAGILHGLIATGMGKFMVAACLNHKRCPHHAIAVGTAVVTVLVVNTCTFVARINADIIDALQQNFSRVLSIALWLIPGVLVGGQIGPRIVARISKRALVIYTSILLILVAIFIFIRVYVQLH
jgi:uncharacterized protein